VLLADPVRAGVLADAARARAAALPGEDEVARDVLAAYAEARARRPRAGARPT
jgi:hypothetical protein